MTLSADVTKQLLAKPPRLLPDGSGYDWREFDRFLQKIYLLLGSQSEQNLSYNVPKQLAQSNTAIQNAALDIESIGVETVFAPDSNFEVIALRKMVEALTTEINMMVSLQPEVDRLERKFDDLSVEIGVS